MHHLANALPGMTAIFNPIDNAVAAIRYIERRYGSVQNVPGVRAVEHGGAYVGYANGGWINEPIKGLGRSGRRYAFGEDGPEYVTPARAVAATRAAPTQPQTVIHVHGDMTESAVRRVVREQQWQSHLHGNR